MNRNDDADANNLIRRTNSQNVQSRANGSRSALASKAPCSASGVQHPCWRQSATFFEPKKAIARERYRRLDSFWLDPILL
jgi:hypothetical protein